jgi:hypothetical protein
MEKVIVDDTFKKNAASRLDTDTIKRIYEGLVEATSKEKPNFQITKKKKPEKQGFRQSDFLKGLKKNDKFDPEFFKGVVSLAEILIEKAENIESLTSSICRKCVEI